MHTPIRLTFLVGAIAGALATVTPALAYVTCPPMTLQAPGAVTPGQAFTLTAQVGGGPGQAVTFSEKAGPSGCAPAIENPSQVTNASGAASTSVSLPSGCSGQVVLAVTTGASCQATATVLAATGAVFPNTSAGRPGPVIGALFIELALAGLALIAAVTLLVAKRSNRRAAVGRG